MAFGRGAAAQQVDRIQATARHLDVSGASAANPPSFHVWMVSSDGLTSGDFGAMRVNRRGNAAFLFDTRREAFVMYSVKGRTCAAFGDPVGPPDRIPELIRAFLARCDALGATPVFYEVGDAYLHHYADFGLSFIKLGEEGRVDLTAFSLEGPHSARFRQSIRRLDKDGGTFEVVPAAGVPAVIGELRSVSDDWLRGKSGGEKGFSMTSIMPPWTACTATRTLA